MADRTLVSDEVVEALARMLEDYRLDVATLALHRLIHLPDAAVVALVDLLEDLCDEDPRQYARAARDFLAAHRLVQLPEEPMMASRGGGAYWPDPSGKHIVIPAPEAPDV